MNIIEVLPENPNWIYSNNPIMLVFHHAEAKNCTIEDINQWHLANGWNGGCGYHFLVRKDGSVYRGRPENAIGAHCPGANNKSLGICAEGDYMKETMPTAQKQALIDLGLYLKNKYGLKQVYGHKELYSTECPGPNYPLDDIKNAFVGNTYNPTTVKPNEALMALQYDLNIDYNAKLTVTGIIDIPTLAALVGIEGIIVKGHKSSVVKWIQQKLIGYGYLKEGQDTGIYDEPTFQAVTNMQKNWNRPTDGILRPETWKIFLEN